MTKEKRDFVKDLLLQNTQHIRDEESFDKFQKRADWLWEGFDRRNKVESRGVTKVKLDDESIKNMNGLIKKWNQTPNIKKNRTKPVDVEKALTKIANDEGLGVDMWGEINRGATEYLKYMVDSNQQQYIPGLQSWLNDKSWKVKIADDRQKQNLGIQTIRQNLAHAKKMLDLNPDDEGWEREVEKQQTLLEAITV